MSQVRPPPPFLERRFYDSRISSVNENAEKETSNLW